MRLTELLPEPLLRAYAATATKALGELALAGLVVLLIGEQMLPLALLSEVSPLPSKSAPLAVVKLEGQPGGDELGGCSLHWWNQMPSNAGIFGNA